MMMKVLAFASHITVLPPTGNYLSHKSFCANANLLYILYISNPSTTAVTRQLGLR